VTCESLGRQPRRIFVRGEVSNRHGYQGNHSPLDGVDLLFTLTSIAIQQGADPEETLKRIMDHPKGAGTCTPVRYPWGILPPWGGGPSPIASLIAHYARWICSRSPDAQR